MSQRDPARRNHQAARQAIKEHDEEFDFANGVVIDVASVCFNSDGNIDAPLEFDVAGATFLADPSLVLDVGPTISVGRCGFKARAAGLVLADPVSACSTATGRKSTWPNSISATMRSWTWISPPSRWISGSTSPDGADPVGVALSAGVDRARAVCDPNAAPGLTPFDPRRRRRSRRLVIHREFVETGSESWRLKTLSGLRTCEYLCKVRVQGGTGQSSSRSTRCCV
ncbi:hypothetical protein [Marinibacterium profundimaris]|uniref:hypothetical protein n=1 Tax=Marinibacterium profundimaris TaxID=1679460 RepID=UPI00117E419A|nr:hypothetical protein [Marinibacterium profundimaris]